MRIGLIDVDAFSRGKCTFPNLALMKLSAWHKSQGDQVQWYSQSAGRFDRVYMSKVFGSEYTKDYPYEVNADEVVRGGSGYAFSVLDGLEQYNQNLDLPLPSVIDHQEPDYALYDISDTAYGFLTKGCPRKCPFCHVAKMQGTKVETVAHLNEFWFGQKNIVLLDPNLTCSPGCVSLLEELAESKAYVDFSQGLDIRAMTDEKLDALNNVKWKRIHFAWDNPNDNLVPLFQKAKEKLSRWRKQTVSCYVLTNFNSTHEQDLERIYAIRELGMQPDVRIYRKPTAPTETKKLQRWCSPYIFWKVDRFEDYQKEGK